GVGAGSSLPSSVRRLTGTPQVDELYHRTTDAEPGVGVDPGQGAKGETTYTKDTPAYGANAPTYARREHRYDQPEDADEDLAVNPAPGTGELFVTVERVCAGGNPEPVAGAIVTVIDLSFSDSQPTNARGEVGFS